MPTPVGTARQCLTDDSARALDEAVAVAKRRSHAQTTSLHAISALLSPSFTILRESLSRARSSAYSPRLQLRALELCVSVSLDRLPSSKNENDNEPPISNSLMAAIKRSQANQRRQPDMYHLNYKMLHHNLSLDHHTHSTNSTTSSSNNNNNNSNSPLSISSVKVELKHFVLSILDDPIVSRVFGEAGFRSSDIKLSIIHPPPRWGPPRCPPLFLCNFTDFGGGGGGDGNCRRIGEVMARGRGRERNPVLVGVCAKDALAGFKETVVKQNFTVLPKELHGVRLVCLEREIKNGGWDEKVEEVRSTVESEGVSGVVVNLGELEGLVVNDDDVDKNNNENIRREKVEGIVREVSELVKSERVWLVASVANYETYSNFVGRFQSVEKHWDLCPLPITSAPATPRSSFDGFGASNNKSSLMGSFVPFGGFFPTPTEFRPPLAAMKKQFTRCKACNDKFDQELSTALREGSSVSVADDEQSSSLPSWLQRADSDVSKAGNLVAQVKDVRNEKISCLQKKWDDNCRLVHQSFPFAAPAVSLASLQIPPPLGVQFMVDMQASCSNSGDSSWNERACSNSSSGLQIVAQSLSPQQQALKADLPNASGISVCHPSLTESSASLMYPISTVGLPLAHTPVSTVSVTTDLGLGTIYASKCKELKKSISQAHQVHLHNFPGSLPTNQGMLSKESAQIAGPSFPLGPSMMEGVDPGDYKLLFRKLSEAVSWQGEAISRISEVVSRCRSGNGHQHATNTRRNIWLSFLGPDKIGKKKIAQALADAVFGSRDRLITVDLSCEYSTSRANSLFLCQGSHVFDIHVSRITVVDHIAQELSKKPHSVVFLENVNEADPLVQESLTHAIQTGKFRDSRGKEVGINNVVFITTSSVDKHDKNLSPRKEFIKFLEEKILEAKNWQMKLAARSVSGDAHGIKETTVSLVSPKCASDKGSPFKRKLLNISDAPKHLDTAKRANNTPKSSLDLNLPLEDVEEAVEMDRFDGNFVSDDARAWLENLSGKMNGIVVFKPFDFDALADSLLRKIRSKFDETLRGQRLCLEIEHEVMVQILAAAWSSDKKSAVQDWIEQVLGTYFAEVRESDRLTAESVVRLGSCEGAPVKEWASGICLPKRINISI